MDQPRKRGVHNRQTGSQAPELQRTRRTCRDRSTALFEKHRRLCVVRWAHSFPHVNPTRNIPDRDYSAGQHNHVRYLHGLYKVFGRSKRTYHARPQNSRSHRCLRTPSPAMETSSLRVLHLRYTAVRHSCGCVYCTMEKKISRITPIPSSICTAANAFMNLQASTD